ncbi:T-complex protein 1 subunit delta [Asimina triloba]
MAVDSVKIKYPISVLHGMRCRLVMAGRVSKLQGLRKWVAGRLCFSTRLSGACTMLCVVRCLVNKRFLIAGGGAPEIELSSYCVREFAEALEAIPYTLAENAGLNPIAIVTELRNRHAQWEINAGINVRKGQITNILEENVAHLLPVSTSAIVLLLPVSTSAITLATECVRMILKIDEHNYSMVVFIRA